MLRRSEKKELLHRQIALLRTACISLSVLVLAGCQSSGSTVEEGLNVEAPYLLVLGVAQDGGHPHAGCDRDCCAAVWSEEAPGHLVSCLALVDPQSGNAWMFDATPDFPRQEYTLEAEEGLALAGIFLTHAHIGHYTGLMHLGREVMGADKQIVYTMPRMKHFLEQNGPWSQLVKLENITLHSLGADSSFIVAPGLRITPFLVPHRDEYSETVGYRIDGPRKSALFIPDIDKWNRWERNIAEMIRSVDYAFLDGTFYQNGEIPRDMSEVPHPFIEESMALLKALPEDERAKVHFIHLNHSNPALQEGSQAQSKIRSQGFDLAVEGGRYGM